VACGWHLGLFVQLSVDISYLLVVYFYDLDFISYSAKSWARFIWQLTMHGCSELVWVWRLRGLTLMAKSCPVLGSGWKRYHYRAGAHQIHHQYHGYTRPFKPLHPLTHAYAPCLLQKTYTCFSQQVCYRKNNFFYRI